MLAESGLDSVTICVIWNQLQVSSMFSKIVVKVSIHKMKVSFHCGLNWIVLEVHVGSGGEKTTSGFMVARNTLVGNAEGNFKLKSSLAIPKVISL